MTALRRLGLEGNRLTTIVADFFYGLDSLEVMNLDHNRIRVSARPNIRTWCSVGVTILFLTAIIIRVSIQQLSASPHT